MYKLKRFIALLLFFILTGCFEEVSKPTDNPVVEEVGFSAELNSTDYFGSKSISRAQTSDLKIVAVPIGGFRPTVKWEGISYLIETPLNSDGTFKINLPKKLKLSSGTFPDGSKEGDTDYVLLVVDKSKPEKDSVISFVSMSDFMISSKISLGGLNSVNTIIKLPISATTGNIDAGVLTANGNEAISSTSSGGSVALSLNQLKMIAQTDDIAKSVKNDYLNPDLETKVFYNWDDTSITTDYNSLITGFSDPGNFRFTNTTITFFELPWAPGKIGDFSAIGNKTTRISLYPPGLPAITNDGTMQFINDDTYEEVGGDFQTTYSEQDDPRLKCSFRSGTSIPATGEWRLTKKVGSGTEEQIGSYDFAVGNPFVTKTSPLDSKINSYVPSIKIAVDGANNVTQIEVKLWMWNGSSYVEVIDYSVLVRDGYQIGLNILNGTTMVYSEDNSIEKKIFTTADFGTVNITALKYIHLSLNPGPFAYEFTWRID